MAVGEDKISGEHLRAGVDSLAEKNLASHQYLLVHKNCASESQKCQNYHFLQEQKC